MKNLILFLICVISGAINAQKFSDTLLAKNRSTEVRDLSKTFFSKGNVEVKNFDDKPVQIQYSILLDVIDYDKIVDKNIFNMIANHVIKYTSYKVKNKYTFMPRSLTFYIKGNIITTKLEYTAQNDYGATKTGDDFGNEYNFDGKFIRNEYDDKRADILGNK